MATDRAGGPRSRPPLATGPPGSWKRWAGGRGPCLGKAVPEGPQRSVRGTGLRRTHGPAQDAWACAGRMGLCRTRGPAQDTRACARRAGLPITRGPAQVSLARPGRTRPRGPPGVLKGAQRCPHPEPPPDPERPPQDPGGRSGRRTAPPGVRPALLTGAGPPWGPARPRKGEAREARRASLAQRPCERPRRPWQVRGPPEGRPLGRGRGAPPLGPVTGWCGGGWRLWRRRPRPGPGSR